MKAKWNIPNDPISTKELKINTDKIDISWDKISNKEFYFVTGLCIGALVVFVTFTSLLMWG